MKKNEIIKNKQADHLLNELKILNLVDHQFCVKFEGFCQDPRFIYIGLELVNGGELFTHLRKNKTFSLTTTKYYTYIYILGSILVTLFQYSNICIAKILFIGI